MASPRVKAPWVGESDISAIYHVTSRCHDRAFLFDDAGKEEFLRLMRLYEDFCGVHVLSHCVMDNHFHILVEVPPRPEGGIPDAELVRRLRLVMKAPMVEVIEKRLATLSSEAATDIGRKAYDDLRETYLQRMWDLSKFMKPIKQRFSLWFNKRNDRVGTLWESRFDSTLVENNEITSTMGAYIDLNPIRAKMCGVERPEDYHWCNYAEALAGNAEARNGIARMLFHADADRGMQEYHGGIEVRDEYTWNDVHARYRIFLYEEGRSRYQEESLEGPVGKMQKRGGFTDEEIAKVIGKEGKLSIREELLHRCKFFSKAAIIGSHSFVEDAISQLKDKEYWPKTKHRKRERHAHSTNFQVNSQPLCTLKPPALE